MTKKRQKNVKRVRVRLYKASAHTPVTIADSAKEAIGKLKRIMHAPDSTFLRIDTRNKNVFKERELEVFFDDELSRKDMVYLSNKMLFVLDSKTAILCTGATLRADDEGFYLDSLIEGLHTLDMEDLPTC